MRRRCGARRLRDISLAALVILAAALAAAALQSINGRVLEGAARVTDGDTLVVDGERIRLRGIDAPERGQICTDGGGAAQPCGQLAAGHLERLIGRETVSCAGFEDDRHGRFLGVCHAGPVGAGSSLNETMVADGWAIAYGGYGRAEAQARAERRGLWAWQFEQPRQWRKRHMAGEAASTVGLGVIVRRMRAVIGWRGHNE